MNRLRIGMIGTGPWGRNLLRTLGGLAQVHVVAVASRSSRREDLPPGEWILERSWAALVERRDLDAVVIALPPGMHAEVVAAALASGLHVLVEKPLALDVSTARALAAQASRAGLVLLVDHIHLFNPAYRALRARVADGRRVLGACSRAGNIGPFRDGVPPLWDWGPHDVALCLDLLGMPAVATHCRCVRHELRAGGLGEILDLGLAHPRDVPARIRIGNLITPKVRRFTVYCEDEILVFDDLAANRLTLHPAAAVFAPVRTPGVALPVASGSPMAAVLHEFARMVRSGERAPQAGDFGAEVVALLASLERQRAGLPAGANELRG